MAQAHNIASMCRISAHRGEDPAQDVDERREAAVGNREFVQHPRYMAGGATNPDPDVFRFAATQVATVSRPRTACGRELCAVGGREGYDTLLNTNLKQEKSQLGRSSPWWWSTSTKSGSRG